MTEQDADEVLELDLNPTVVPIRLKGIDKQVRLYEIRDITGKQRDKFLTDQARKLALGGKGQPKKGQDFTGYQSGLISLCLWDMNKYVRKLENSDDGGVTEEIIQIQDGDGNPVPPARVAEEVIQRWPARVQAAINKKCEPLSGLEQPKKGETEEEEKND